MRICRYISARAGLIRAPGIAAAAHHPAPPRLVKSQRFLTMATWACFFCRCSN